MSSILEITLAIVTYFVVALVGMKILARLGFVTAKGGANVASVRPLLAAASINLVIAGLVILEHLAFGGTLADLRARLAPVDLGWALLGVGLLLFVAAAYARVAGGRRTTPSAGPALTLLLVGALFCAALMEEIVFRAVVIGALVSFGTGLALAVSTIIFAVIHLPTNKVTAEGVTGWVLGGLGFGGAWLAGAPLVVVTAVHFAHNLGNVLWVRPAAQFGRVEVARDLPAGRLLRYLVDVAVILTIALAAYVGP